MPDTLINILAAITCLTFGYLLGSIQHGIIIGKLFFHKDPRDYGSHNSGGTNSGRVFGFKIGVLVIVLDMLKVIIAFWSCWAVLRFSGMLEATNLWDGGSFYVYLAPLGAAIGHCWPIYHKFRGGKTVSCYMGLNGGVSWVMFLVCFAAFFSVFLRKKIVSISSIISSMLISLSQWVLAIIIMITDWKGNEILTWTFGLGNLGSFHYFGWEAAMVSTVIMIMLIYRHIPNIKRLREGTEKPILK